MSITQLNELYMEMEVLIREFSETLINELALRDELEYEKEMKNTFISLLLAVQNKRRQFHVEKKRNKTQGKPTTNGMRRKNGRKNLLNSNFLWYFIKLAHFCHFWFRSGAKVFDHSNSISFRKWHTRQSSSASVDKK